MTRLDALQALAEKVEAGDEKWVHLPRTSDLRTDLVWKAWSGSLDAAKALHDAALPGWDADLTLSGGATVFRTLRIEGFDAFVPNKLARAWLLAILKALIAQEQAKGDE